MTKSRRYITPEQFGERFSLTRAQSYEVFKRNLPKELVLRFGRRIRIDEEGLDQWVANGGAL